MIPNRKFGPPAVVVSGVHEVRRHGMRREYLSVSFPFPLSLPPSLPLSILPSGIWQTKPMRDQVHILLSPMSAAWMGVWMTHLNPRFHFSCHIRAVCLEGSYHPGLPMWVDVKIPFPKLGFLWLAGVICHKSRWAEV